MTRASFQQTYQANVTNGTGIYASGDLIGAKITLPGLVPFSGGAGLIQKVVVSDPSKQSAALDVVFFNADPSGTTFTDNAALDVADADLAKIVGHLNITASEYAAFNDNSVATLREPLAFRLNATTALYAAVVSRGTPTYVGTSELKLTVDVI